MAKLIAISVLVIPLLIARRSARMRDPRRGMSQTVSLSLAFSIVYVIAVIFLFFRLG